MNSNPCKIGIIGAGGWGTAIADILVSNGHNVLIWSFEYDVAQEINTSHQNSTFLSGVLISESVVATNDINSLIDSELLVFAVPTQFVRNILNQSNGIFKNKPIINLAKGIEKKSLLRLSEVFGEFALDYAVLTGPSHAEEVARRSPTTVVAASENPTFARQVQETFSNSSFRVYTSDDVIGCEIGGSLKNVIAIAAGIIDGLGMGDNTKAALITRGLAEISRLGVALGANPLTFSGLSGLGDLIVTCNSRHSRNRSVGEKIGRGLTMEEISSGMKMVAEGISTTESAFFLGKKHNVEMPITEQMYKILFDNTQPLEAIKSLMNRQSKREWWW